MIAYGSEAETEGADHLSNPVSYRERRSIIIRSHLVRTPILALLLSLAASVAAQEWIDFGTLDGYPFGRGGEDQTHVRCMDAHADGEAWKFAKTYELRNMLGDTRIAFPGGVVLLCEYAHMRGTPRYSPFTLPGPPWKYVATDGLQYAVRSTRYTSASEAPTSLEVVYRGDAGTLLPGGRFQTLVYLHEAERGAPLTLCLHDVCRDIELPPFEGSPQDTAGGAFDGQKMQASYLSDRRCGAGT